MCKWNFRDIASLRYDATSRSMGTVPLFGIAANALFRGFVFEPFDFDLASNDVATIDKFVFVEYSYHINQTGILTKLRY